jgi:threonine/homoserine/homoserine lactone efflux protein
MFETLIPYALYCLSMSGTPGPNNIMVMASGVNYGYRRTLPHILGINIGFSVMLAIMALGFGSIFLAEPRLQIAMKYCGIAYMLWLAWKIATAKGISQSETSAQPFSFIQAAAFQWVNVKAWFMVLGAISVYAPSGYGPLEKALYLGGIMMIVGSPPTHAWTLFGVGIRRYLENPRALRLFNLTMAGLLVLSLIPMVF